MTDYTNFDDRAQLYSDIAVDYVDVAHAQVELLQLFLTNTKTLNKAVYGKLTDDQYKKTLEFIDAHLPEFTDSDIKLRTRKMMETLETVLCLYQVQELNDDDFLKNPPDSFAKFFVDIRALAVDKLANN